MFCCSRITLDEDRVVEGDDLYMPDCLREFARCTIAEEQTRGEMMGSERHLLMIKHPIFLHRYTSALYPDSKTSHRSQIKFVGVRQAAPAA
jgi:hypothetical protein